MSLPQGPSFFLWKPCQPTLFLTLKLPSSPTPSPHLTSALAFFPHVKAPPLDADSHTLCLSLSSLSIATARELERERASSGSSLVICCARTSSAGKARPTREGGAAEDGLSGPSRTAFREIKRKGEDGDGFLCPTAY
jgi:hypothetical protein